MEALTLTRADYTEALKKINETLGDASYVSLFTVKFPDGINTASTLEICRTIQAPTFENKVNLLKICIEGKNVEVKCPNGDTEKFCMTNRENNFEGFPLFQKDPMALVAIADAVYGYILKKYVRLSMAQEPAAKSE
jgi:hypothetical protein